LFWLLLSALVMGSRIVLRDLLRFDLRFSIVGLLDDAPQFWGHQVLLAMPSTPPYRDAANWCGSSKPWAWR